jgi:hypothetical protein
VLGAAAVADRPPAARGTLLAGVAAGRRAAGASGAAARLDAGVQSRPPIYLVLAVRLQPRAGPVGSRPLAKLDQLKGLRAGGAGQKGRRLRRALPAAGIRRPAWRRAIAQGAQSAAAPLCTEKRRRSEKSTTHHAGDGTWSTPLKNASEAAGLWGGCLS